ncbi:MAG TPA: hypothetical protein IAB61_11850 [Candidatus Merdisoma merdipullorum]|nr:hypothetical protein [Candidatus Merdisoma merdipullorum]
MARRNYKFTDKKHTRQGLASLCLGAAALILTVLSLALAYRMSGEAGSIVGLLGVFAMLSSVVGFVLAVRGFQEEDVYYISSQIGSVLNGLLFIGWALVCMIGM